MDNKDINIGDILPPNKDIEKFATADSVVPQFIKTAAYESGEVLEQTIQRDWLRLVEGLNDYVLAEQLTERELLGIGKPVAENYSAYFHDTLKDVKKNRKKAEQRLFKLIPRHSQLEACEFFQTVEEQCAKEQEARERSIAIYPPAGVEKLERKDVARAGIKKEAAEQPLPEQEAFKCPKCGKDLIRPAGSSTHCLCGEDIPPTFKELKKEAAGKWEAGQRLYCKISNEMNKCAFATVVYVNEDDKTYTIKVSGVMLPSYYAFDDAHKTFDAVDKEESQDSDWAKAKGLTLRAQDEKGLWRNIRKSKFLPDLQIKARLLVEKFPDRKVEIVEDPSNEKFSF